MEPNQKKSWGKRIAIGGIAIVALAGVGVPSALSQDCGGMQRLGMGGGGSDMHMQAKVRDEMGLVEREFKRMLEEIDATPEQEKKLEAIRDELFFDVSVITLGFFDTLEDFDKLPTIDREAAEKLRAEFVAVFDKASRKLKEALIDDYEVLTPEQRAKLAE
ncbi:hypothetical protein B5V02_12675 [Mesorhizobium kowhaii]|uniref:Spy/CpxP family protein refolding chaperone n=2 Tax=Mesorhizobium kowhaii TaxID=1300272 RepID=A0A2W7E4I9_9HYPH|nr:hypothetical protein B5V02_12675 [Mesorhizobium kowhaii]